jgi:hypothetical protein
LPDARHFAPTPTALSGSWGKSSGRTILSQGYS